MSEDSNRLVAEAAAGSDRELVRDFARDGSESAFQALVGRHVRLVYGAVLRQVGDPGMAEEVTQNVFIALARKAPRLAGHATLAGWLHRTAVLEAKARIRAELRRRRREEMAAALAAVERESGAGVVADEVAPWVDEGLLSLRDGDRLALVLRFFEERSLKEVGRVLGVDEDAARKRVARALARLTEFLQARGVALPAAGGMATALSGSAGAATVPAGLAGSAAAAGLASAGGTGIGAAVWTWVLGRFGGPARIPTALACTFLVGAPLAWQERVVAARGRELTEEQRALVRAREDLAASELAWQALRERHDLAARQTAEARRRLREREAGPDPGRMAGDAGAVTAAYRWDDASPLARVPKELFRQRPPVGMRDATGRLTAEVREVLQLGERDVDRVETALAAFLRDYHSLGRQVARSIVPDAKALRGMAPGDVRAFEVAGIRERVMDRRDRLLEELRSMLEPDRADILIRSLGETIPMEGSTGFHSGRVVWPEDHRVGYFRYPVQLGEQPVLGRWIDEPGRGSLSGPIAVDEVPPYAREGLADWIEEARTLHALTREQATRSREEKP